MADMRVIDVVQGTPEWLSARCGKVTASRIDAVMALLKKGGESSARAAYRKGIAGEIMTGLAEANFVNAAMTRGIEQEPFARAAYEMRADVLVEQVGFVLHPTIDQAGSSPDGLVGKDGLIEIKCPNTATHIDYIIGKEPPADYQPQMLWQMACCEREWCDFVSFDDRIRCHDLQLFVVRFYRDEERIKQMEMAVRQFLEEVNEVLAQLNYKEEQQIAQVIARPDMETDLYV